MPLDPRKALHVQSAVNRSFQYRQRTVTFVYQVSGGSGYSYVAVSAMLKPLAATDPQIPDQVGGTPRRVADLICVVPLGTNFIGLVCVADTATATAAGVAAAKKYQAVEVITSGLLPGGTKIRALLRRMR